MIKFGGPGGPNLKGEAHGFDLEKQQGQVLSEIKIVLIGNQSNLGEWKDRSPAKFKSLGEPFQTEQTKSTKASIEWLMTQFYQRARMICEMDR